MIEFLLLFLTKLGILIFLYLLFGVFYVGRYFLKEYLKSYRYKDKKENFTIYNFFFGDNTGGEATIVFIFFHLFYPFHMVYKSFQTFEVTINKILNFKLVKVKEDEKEKE